MPPMPPQIHRRLTLSITSEGVILRPKSSSSSSAFSSSHTSTKTSSSGPSGGKEKSERGIGGGDGLMGVKIKWGLKGKIESVQGGEDGTVDLGGILGIVRLWDGAF